MARARCVVEMLISQLRKVEYEHFVREIDVAANVKYQTNNIIEIEILFFSSSVLFSSEGDPSNMDRFKFIPAVLQEAETFVAKHRSIKIYNGEQKVSARQFAQANFLYSVFDNNFQTNYEDGEVVLTTHRLLWGRDGEIAHGQTVLSLRLQHVINIGEETASSFVFGKKKRIILHLAEPDGSDRAPGPVGWSREPFIKLSGRNGIDESFTQSLQETVAARIWEVQSSEGGQTSSPAKDPSNEMRRITLRTGIVGIERTIQEQHKQTDENITLAFQDLSKLMAMAKDMVAVSKVVSSKIRERQGDISEDETVRFKSYLMSLGIDDPVTRGSSQSNTEYFQRLGNQICEVLLDPITECGGMMSLADVYCRINRARGLELISPEDLLNACQTLRGPIKLRRFPSGAMVLQLESHDDQIVAEETAEEVEKSKCIDVEELARVLGISLLLAQERLSTAERFGKICRDESIEGIKFYPNLLLQSN